MTLNIKIKSKLCWNHYRQTQPSCI